MFHSKSDALRIKAVVEGEFLAFGDVVKSVEDYSPITFSECADIGLWRMVNKARLVAANNAVNASAVSELHEAGKADRIVESLAAPHFSFW